MKNLIKLALMLILLSTISCVLSPTFGDTKHPFRISSIEKINDSLVYYNSNQYAKKTSIIAKRGLYNIGDTILLKK